MQRRRNIAAAPFRSASQAVGAATTLIIESLEPASAIDDAEVLDALAIARPALLALVAGGHLEDAGLTLIAGSLHLSINFVSGDQALTIEENLGVVPGAATAEEWNLYLPKPEPLAALVDSVTASHEHLSNEEAPEAAGSEASSAAPLVDLSAFAARKG